MISHYSVAFIFAILSIHFLVNGFDEVQPLERGNSNYSALLNYNVIVQRSPDAIERDLMCSGSLVAYHKIVTVAHCFFNSTRNAVPKDNFAVILGDLGDANSSSVVMGIKEIIIHPEYDPIDRRNDLAIVVLDGMIAANAKAIAPIGLATYNISDGVECWITTWISLFKSWSLSEVLQEIPVEVIDRELCNQTESNYRTICMYGHEAILDRAYFLSGTPLVCNHILAGISSQTIRSNIPIAWEAFTNINYYLTWITENGACGNHFRKILLFIVACNLCGLIINVSI